MSLCTDDQIENGPCPPWRPDYGPNRYQLLYSGRRVLREAASSVAEGGASLSKATGLSAAMAGVALAVLGVLTVVARRHRRHAGAVASIIAMEHVV